MSPTKRSVIILAFTAVLMAVAIYFIFPPGSSTRLGLDLQGGLAVILEAQDTAQAPRTEEGMSQAVNIINDRINRLGVTEPEVQRQGQWKISIQLPGVDDPAQALELIGKTALLEFYDTADFGTAYTNEADALAAAEVTSALELPAGTRLVHWPKDAGTTQDTWFLVTTPPLLTGADLEGADIGLDQNNQPKVDMQFTSDGAQKFEDATTQLAQRAQITGQDQLLAIILDGQVESAPRVQEPISGGRAEITGRFTTDEAKNLALVLQTGALPVELSVLQQRVVGATLGKASLDQALFAGAIGLILIAIVMIVFYRLLGVVADIALFIYAILFWGLLNAVGVTLTLPGVAGIILTLGVAVDANVIIFARMKDEVRAGKSVRTAIDAGFHNAMSAIIDGNVLTLLTAAVLFWLSTGGVRGFALTLAMGVLLSMFTAIVVTRSLLYLLSGLKVFNNYKLLGLGDPGAPERRVIPFMRYRKWYMVSLGTVTVLAFLAVFVLGLNLGIDFEGGVRAEVKLAQAASTADVGGIFEEAGAKDPIVQTAGDNVYVVTAAEMSDEQFNAAVAAMVDDFGAEKTAAGIERVGPSFGQETSNKAFIAIVVSILLMIAYLSWRFEYKFALPAIVALVHDIGLTLAVYALTGRLMTAATVAALLTILGYSVYDTVIVFDRIRENQRSMKRESYEEMVNRSITQTIVRSLMTTSTALIPVLCILFFGGATLQDFAFALLVGIASGAYSSVFVASPLVVYWKEREPRYRKRAAAAAENS